MLANGDTGPTPSVEHLSGRQDSMTSKDAVFQRADGTLSDPWGNTVEADEISFGDAPEDEEPAAPDYSTMTAQELKDEVARRQAEGREFDLSGVKVKADLVALLEADDAAQEG